MTILNNDELKNKILKAVYSYTHPISIMRIAIEAGLLKRNTVNLVEELVAENLLQKVLSYNLSTGAASVYALTIEGKTRIKEENDRKIYQY